MRAIKAMIFHVLLNTNQGGSTSKRAEATLRHMGQGGHSEHLEWQLSNLNKTRDFFLFLIHAGDPNLGSGTPVN